MKLTLYQMDMKCAYLNRYLNVKFEDFPFTNRMKKIMENLIKSHDKVTQENNHVMNNVSDNIDDVVNDFGSTYEGFIPMSNEVHDGSILVNEGVSKDACLCKRSDKKSYKIVDGNKILINVCIASL